MNSLLLAALALSAVDAQDVSVHVDLSALTDAADENTEKWILDDARRTMESTGHRLTEEGADHVITVSVSWYGDKDLNTLISVGLDDAEPVELRCVVCDEEQWLPLLDAEIGKIAAQLSEDAEQPPPNRPPQGIAKTPSNAQVTDPGDRPPPMTWLGGAGIGLGFVGAGLLAAGGLDIALGRRRNAEGDDPGSLVADNRRTGRGATFVALGSLAAASGVSMIAVDLVRQRRKRSATVVPSFGPRLVGLHLQGRF